METKLLTEVLELEDENEEGCMHSDFTENGICGDCGAEV